MTDGAVPEDFLDLVYDAALDSALWVSVLDRFADLVGADAANLSRLDVESGEGSAVTARVDPAVLDSYFAYFAQRNPILTVDDFSEYSASWAPRVLIDEDTLSRETFVRSEYYNDFMKPIRSDWLMMVRLSLKGREIASLALGRRESKGRFDGGELDLAGRLQPHLIRAFSLGRKLASTGELTGGVAQALDRSEQAMWVLDGSGRVLHMNQAAERLLRTERILTVQGGRLTARNALAGQRLAALISAAGAYRAADRRGGGMALNTPDRRLPLGVTVTPVRPTPLSLFQEHPTVLVHVSDPNASAGPSEQALADIFGLTTAEARLARGLVEGLDLHGVAERHGISFYTVRGQLASIFSKVGVHRQPDLIRVLLGVGRSGADAPG